MRTSNDRPTTKSSVAQNVVGETALAWMAHKWEKQDKWQRGLGKFIAYTRIRSSRKGNFNWDRSNDFLETPQHVTKSHSAQAHNVISFFAHCLFHLITITLQLLSFHIADVALCHQWWMYRMPWIQCMTFQVKWKHDKWASVHLSCASSNCVSTDWDYVSNLGLDMECKQSRCSTFVYRTN